VRSRRKNTSHAFWSGDSSACDLAEKWVVGSPAFYPASGTQKGQVVEQANRLDFLKNGQSKEAIGWLFCY
jgi:hypothetical protein